MLNRCKLLFISMLFIEFLFLTNNSLFSQYSISGYVLYSDNNQPVANDKVYISVYNPSIDREEFLDSTVINKDGSYYLVTTYNDSVLEKVGLIEEITSDHVSTYYPSNIDWKGAVSIYPPDNPQRVNIYVQRIVNQNGLFDLSGTITTIDTNLNTVPLSRAIVVAQKDSILRSACITDSSGNFILDSLGEGEFLILANKIGYSSNSAIVTVGGNIRSIIHPTLSIKHVINKRNKFNKIAINFHLYQNYPNPFNPSTKIRFLIPSNSKNEALEVSLIIYNVLGQEVAKLIDRKLSPGDYEVTWKTEVNPSGVYFYRLEANNYMQIKRMILLK
jgi:hypothetical protein